MINPDEIRRAIERLERLIAKSKIAWLQPQVTVGGEARSDNILYVDIALVAHVACRSRDAATFGDFAPISDAKKLHVSEVMAVKLVNDSEWPDRDKWINDKLNGMSGMITMTLLKGPE